MAYKHKTACSSHCDKKTQVCAIDLHAAVISVYSACPVPAMHAATMLDSAQR